MAPVMQRLFRLQVLHYKAKSKSDDAFYRWVTENHGPDASKIHSKHGVVSFGISFSPTSIREVAHQVNTKLGNPWVIDDHDVAIELIVTDPMVVADVLTDPAFKALQADEEPWVNPVHMVARFDWVEQFVVDGVVSKPISREFQSV